MKRKEKTSPFGVDVRCSFWKVACDCQRTIALRPTMSGMRGTSMLGSPPNTFRVHHGGAAVIPMPAEGAVLLLSLWLQSQLRAPQASLAATQPCADVKKTGIDACCLCMAACQALVECAEGFIRYTSPQATRSERCLCTQQQFLVCSHAQTARIFTQQLTSQYKPRCVMHSRL